jgi:5-methylcytosine-specific restriction endonuclease McrA
MIRVCSICKFDKDSETDFYVKDKKSGRLFSWCKECHVQKTNKKYHDNRDDMLAKMKEQQAVKKAADPEAFAAAQREATRRWRENNPEAAKASERRSDAKRRDNGQRKAYREANKDKIKASSAEYRAANKDKIDASNKAYRETNRELLKLRDTIWRIENPERDRERRQRWKRANKAIINAGVHRYRARYHGCAEHHTAAEWESLKAACEFTCLCCGRQEPDIKLTKDHIVPISHAGTSNAITNLQPLCMDCNTRKGDTVADFRAVPTSPEDETLLDELDASREQGEQADEADDDRPGFVFSVIGPHAGEEMAVIFARKRADIAAVGRTFWMVRSHLSKPPVVQALCEDGGVPCYFLEPARAGGSVPTTVSQAATAYSADGENWEDMPEGLSPVTGNLAGKGGWALVLESLEVPIEEMTVDLADFVAAEGNTPLVFRQGASTVCAKAALEGPRVKNVRRVAVMGMLVAPYCVWIRAGEPD